MGGAHRGQGTGIGLGAGGEPVELRTAFQGRGMGGGRRSQPRRRGLVSGLRGDRVRGRQGRGGGGPGVGQLRFHRGGFGLPVVELLLQHAPFVVPEQRLRGGLRGVESCAVGGVGQPGVGLLEPLGAGVRRPGRLRRRGEQGDLPLQPCGPVGHARAVAPRPGQLLFQGGPFAVQRLTVGGTRSGPALGLLLLVAAPFVLTLGASERLAGGMEVSAERMGAGEVGAQLLDLRGEFTGRGVPRRGGRCASLADCWWSAAC